MTGKWITYGASPYGYTVQVMRGDKIVDEYTAGNNAHESTGVVALDSPACEEFATLQKWARQTALEIAEERGISLERVFEEADLGAELTAQYEGEI